MEPLSINRGCGWPRRQVDAHRRPGFDAIQDRGLIPTAAAQLHWGEGGLLVLADKQNPGLSGFGHDRDRRDEGLGGALAGLEIHVGSHADQQPRCRFSEAQLHIEGNDVVCFFCPGCDLVDRRLKALVCRHQPARLLSVQL